MKYALHRYSLDIHREDRGKWQPKLKEKLKRNPPGQPVKVQDENQQHQKP